MHYDLCMGYTPEYYEKNKEKILERGRKWRAENPDRMRGYLKTYADKNKDKIRLRVLKYQQRNSLNAASLRDKDKLAALSFYGVNGVARCRYPGFTVEDLDMLCLDHIEHNGADERRISKGLSGTFLYRRLIKIGFPEGYQTLCANHNLKKEVVWRRKLTEEAWHKQNT